MYGAVGFLDYLPLFIFGLLIGPAWVASDLMSSDENCSAIAYSISLIVMTASILLTLYFTNVLMTKNNNFYDQEHSTKLVASYITPEVKSAPVNNLKSRILIEEYYE